MYVKGSEGASNKNYCEMKDVDPVKLGGKGLKPFFQGLDSVTAAWVTGNR